jgi:hypothetical protein
MPHPSFADQISRKILRASQSAPFSSGGSYPYSSIVIISPYTGIEEVKSLCVSSCDFAFCHLAFFIAIVVFGFVFTLARSSPDSPLHLRHCVTTLAAVGRLR